MEAVEIIEITPQEIFKRVISNIPENYGSEPIILTGFLRTRKLVNDTLAEFSEAIIEDYKSGYYLYPRRERYKKAQSTDIPCLIKGRAVTDTMLLNELIGTGDYSYNVGSYFVDFIECYHGQFFDPSEFKMRDYLLTKLIDQDNNFTYKISFDQKPGTKGLLHKGEVFIDPVDFAIKRIVVTYSPNGYIWYNRHYGKIRHTLRQVEGWNCEAPATQATFTWCKNNGKWFLHSKVIDWKMVYTNPILQDKFHYHFQMELVIMDYTRSPAVTASFKGDKQLGVHENWDKIIGEMDEKYWDNFNYLPIEESLKQAITNMPSFRQIPDK